MDRKQFEEWFKTTLSYAIFEDSNVWKVDLYAFNEPTNSYLHSGVQAAFESYQHLQAKVEELQKRVDAAIKCADLNFWNANTVKAMVEALKGEGQ
ncbi:hypothetical protein OHW69_08175 [Acinetobacter baumannii]|nr:hypothetical protein [Acinetobacter baumannii]